jgi:hypothetical protein
MALPLRLLLLLLLLVGAALQQPRCVPDRAKGTTCLRCNNTDPSSACEHDTACPSSSHACCWGQPGVHHGHCECTPKPCPPPGPAPPPSPTPPVPVPARVPSAKHIDWYCGELRLRP